MDTEQMSLQEFIRAVKYNTWLFEKQWLNNHPEEPREWPLKMSVYEWVEQMMIWVEQHDLEVVNELQRVSTVS